MVSQLPTAEIQPTTIYRHAFGVYRSTAMLAGMQLDVFTPLQHEPMTAEDVAHALHVRPDKLRPLLYALVEAELLTVDGDRFNNTPEADRYLVRGRPNYIGGAHELWSDLWTAALQSARSIRAGSPQAKHDFTAMSSSELGAFLRAQSRRAGSWPPSTASSALQICWTSGAAQVGSPLRPAKPCLT
jgi:2-hydroxy-4-(methylsulfanyl)butanoate S-methyltransferase